jgi:hypothetical protein
MQDYGSFFKSNSLIVETPQLCAGKVRLEAPDKRRVHFLQEKLMHASINAKVDQLSARTSSLGKCISKQSLHLRDQRKNYHRVSMSVLEQ